MFDFIAEIRPWIVPSVGSSGEDATAKRPVPSLVDTWAMQRLGLECSRTVGVWVAEDPESLPQRFVDALPVLLALRARAEVRRRRGGGGAVERTACDARRDVGLSVYYECNEVFSLFW